MSQREKAAWCVWCIIIAAALVILAITLQPAWGHFADHEKWAQLTPEMQRWFRGRSYRTPDGLVWSCCTDRDAEEVEEDIRDGHYFVRSKLTSGQWVPVPDEAVLREPNKYGQPVVWWKTLVPPVPRCFAPGSGM